MPETVSSSERTFDRTMVNITKRQYEDELTDFLAEHPETSRDEVEATLKSQREAGEGQPQ
jgi:hypothetical protein